MLSHGTYMETSRGKSIHSSIAKHLVDLFDNVLQLSHKENNIVFEGDEWKIFNGDNEYLVTASLVNEMYILDLNSQDFACSVSKNTSPSLWHSIESDSRNYEIG